MFTRLFSLLTTDRFISNYLKVLDRENDIIKCQILVEIIIIEDNIFHLLWRICVISYISIIYRFQTKWLPRRRRSRTRYLLVCIYISLTGKYLKTPENSKCNPNFYQDFVSFSVGGIQKVHSLKFADLF